MPSLLLSPLTKKAIQDLREEGGNVDALEHFVDLVEINELAEEVRNPRPGTVTDEILDCPVECGGVKFRQLSIAGRLWLRDVALPCFEEDPGMVALAIAYAMAYRDESLELSDSREIRARVKRFAKKELRHVTEESLMNLFAHFGMTQSREVTDDPEGDDREEYGTLIALLVREYHGTPHYWIYQAPKEMIEACIRDVLIKAHLEAASAQKAQAKASGGKGPKRAIAPDPDSPTMRAQIRLNKRLRAFREKVLADG